MPGYIIYCRKSSEAEDRQVLSNESQTRELNSLAAKLNLPIDQVLVESKSAKEPGRPVFNQLMQRVYRGEVAGIICWKLDRLARNPVDGGSIIWAIKQHGIKVVTPAQTYAREDENIILMYIEFGMAQKYVDDLSKNVKRGLKTKVENGWYPGVAPMGYLNHTDKATGENMLVKDPERFPLVRKMWNLMLTGHYTPPQIVKLANEQWGFRTRVTRKQGGRCLARSAIYKTFTKPFYCGEFEYPNGSGKWYAAKHEPMVTRSEYDRVQVLLGRSGSPRPRAHRNFAFTGMIRCGECNRMVTAEEKRQIICDGCGLKFARGNREACLGCRTPILAMKAPVHLQYAYYHCSKSRGKACTQKSVKLPDLEGQILAALHTISISKEFKEWGIKYLHELYESDAESQSQILASQQQAYQACLGQIEGLVALKTAAANRDGSLLSDGEYAEQRGRLIREKTTLEEAMKNLETLIEDAIKLSKRVLEFSCLLEERFREGDAMAKKGILLTMASNLTLKDKILKIEARKPFTIIAEELSPEKALAVPIEPKNVQATQGRPIPSVFMRSYVRCRRDDVRTLYRKRKRMVQQIYRFFKNVCCSPKPGLSEWLDLLQHGENTNWKN